MHSLIYIYDLKVSTFVLNRGKINNQLKLILNISKITVIDNTKCSEGNYIAQLLSNFYYHRLIWKSISQGIIEKSETFHELEFTNRHSRLKQKKNTILLFASDRQRTTNCQLWFVETAAAETKENKHRFKAAHSFARLVSKMGKTGRNTCGKNHFPKTVGTVFRGRVKRCVKLSRFTTKT